MKKCRLVFSYESIGNVNEKKILVGNWTNTFDEELLANYDCQFLDNIWNDKKNIFDAISFCDSLYEKIIVKVTDELNELHLEDNDIGYWKIIIGPWLRRFIHVLYEKYRNIEYSIAAYPNASATILNKSDFLIPFGWSDFQSGLESNQCEYQLYSDLVPYMGITYDYLQQKHGPQDWPKQGALSIKNKIRNILCEILFRVAIHRKVVLASLFNSKLAELTLFFRNPLKYGLLLRSKPEYIPIADAGINWDFRDRKNSLGNIDSFENIVGVLLWKYMPTSYMEYYKLLKTKYAARKNRIKFIASAYGWKSDDRFKFFVASLNNKKTKLAGAQHGGASGISFYSPTEQHIMDVTDIYYTYGSWSNDANTQSIAFPKLANVLLHGEKQTANNVLFVGTTAPQYFIHFKYGPLGRQFLYYQNDQILLIKALSKKIRRNLLMRTVDHLWNTQTLLQNKFLDIKFDSFHRSFEKQVSCSKVVVIDNINTTFTQTMMINKPIVLYVNEMLWNFSDSFQPMMYDLLEAKILFFNIEQAAKRVISLYDNPNLWYEDELLSNVRMKFLNSYAPKDGDWISEWNHFFKSNI